MKLTLEEVEHIAWLARLELSEEEKGRYCEQLSAILDYADRLRMLDTSQVSPTASINAENSNLRLDIVEQSRSEIDILFNAPQKQQNQFRIPPVIELSP